MGNGAGDEAAIVAVINEQRIAYWMRDYDAWQRCFRHQPYLTRWGWWRQGGIFEQHGWDEISERFKRELAEYPTPNPANAYDTRIENLNLRIVGNLAWATFNQRCPEPDLAGRHGRRRGAHVTHELRILDRDSDGWRVVLNSFMDSSDDLSDQTLILDRSCRVIDASEAALASISKDDDLVIRNGTLHARNHRADQSIQQAARRVSGADGTYLPLHVALPIVVDSGDEHPARVWWVAAEEGRIRFSFGALTVAEDRLDMAAYIFNLSPSQKRLAGLLVEGLALPQVAERLGVTHNTARTHLKRVYEKTGVHTQTALIRVLLSTTSPL